MKATTTFNSKSNVFTEWDSFQLKMLPRWSMWILFQSEAIFPEIRNYQNLCYHQKIKGSKKVKLYTERIKLLVKHISYSYVILEISKYFHLSTWMDENNAGVRTQRSSEWLCNHNTIRETIFSLKVSGYDKAQE